MTLKELRKRIHLTQKELGEKLEITGQAIANYENKKRIPTIIFAVRYAKVLGVSLEEFALCYQDL